MNSNQRSYQTRQSPGGNSSFNLSWENKPSDRPIRNIEEEKAKQDIQDEKLEKILKAEERRKQLCKKEVKTSVKVNKPPGGVNNFFLG